MSRLRPARGERGSTRFSFTIADPSFQGIHGSSTCLLALLHHSSLLIANIGDCCLLVIRNGQVVFRTSEMQHAFNFPLQLGTHSRDEPMKDAQRFTVEVEKEDVVVVGSDGLMDNLVSARFRMGRRRDRSVTLSFSRL